MEALELEGALLQRSLNNGRKLLKEKSDLEKEVQVLNEHIKKLEAERFRLESENHLLLQEMVLMKKDVWKIKENMKTINWLYGQSELNTEKLILEINTLRKANEELRKSVTSREEHTP